MPSPKCIILAGGLGTRLAPLTNFACKQLLPVFDKPAIYYPINLALLSGIREILIISTPDATPQIASALGDGSKFGCVFEYVVQREPRGIAEALILGESFLANSDCLLLLGDNILIKGGYTEWVSDLFASNKGATIVGTRVDRPQEFGVIEIDSNSKDVVNIEEKPERPKTNIASIGMYVYDGSASQRAKQLKPSDRGELEITDLNLSYLADKQLSCSVLSRGDFWADIGHFDSLLACANMISLSQSHSNTIIGSPEEAALNSGFIDRPQFLKLVNSLPKNRYSEVLRRSVDDKL